MTISLSWWSNAAELVEACAKSSHGPRYCLHPFFDTSHVSISCTIASTGRLASGWQARPAYVSYSLGLVPWKWIRLALAW